MGKRIKRQHFKDPETRASNQVSINERKIWYNEVCSQVVTFGVCDPNCIWVKNCELKDGKVHKVAIPC